MSLVLTVSSREKEIPERIKASIRSLLTECLAHEAITAKEQKAIATAMANTRDWDTWSVVVRVNAGFAAKNSLMIIQKLLQDSSIPEEQLGAVSALRVLLQSVAPPSDFAGQVVCAIGADMMAVFQSYGTLTVSKEAQSHQTTACAECMVKIVLFAYQQFAADSESSDATEMATFLGVLFQSFISVLRFNGLPNHPPPQAGSDPVVGRMCAQAITHIARTSHDAVALQIQHGQLIRASLSCFGVCGEMSGYATASAVQAPAKKKLNLKSFKK